MSPAQHRRWALRLLKAGKEKLANQHILLAPAIEERARRLSAAQSSPTSL
jgi:hypothetical protein